MGSSNAATGKSGVAGGKSGKAGAGQGGTVQVSLDRGAAQDLLVALTNALGGGGAKNGKQAKAAGGAKRATGAKGAGGKSGKA